MIDAHSLSLVAIEGDNQGSNKGLYHKAFQLWYDVWSQTFRELDDSKHIPSDDFTRQDEILALFHKEQCVALICHRYVETDNPAIWYDSYFNPWPSHAKEALRTGKHLVIGSQISIHPDFRGRSHGMSLKELIVHCSLSHLAKKDVDAITGVMRADKAMHHLFYACGAQPLERGLVFHNVPVDLVAFFPKTHPIQVPDTYKAAVNDLVTALSHRRSKVAS